VSGLRNGATFNATESCSAGPASPAGAYPIVPVLISPNNGLTNYQVTLVNGTLTVTAAVLLNPAPDTLGVGQGPMLLDSTASVSDGGSLNFGGGTLTVAVAANAAAADSLSVEPSGANSGQIGLVGNSVTWSGAELAAFGGGAGTNALIFSLTTNATSASLTALLQRVAFASLDTNSDTRVVAVTLAYGDITVSATINVHLVSIGQLRLTVMPSGAVAITFAGTPGQAYQIQASADLDRWTVLETVTASPTGAIQSLDTAAVNYPDRFYRAVAQ
jgi:hypothetical protein